MPPNVVVFIDNKDKPANIPGYETIIQQCRILRPLQATAININGVRITLEKTSDNEVGNIWVKFGGGITVGEAKTQDFVAKYLEDNDNSAVRAPRVYVAFTWGRFCYIVMEYIEGRMCNNSDISLIAAAVKSLIAIPSPSLTPGPVGGGTIEHPFFVDQRSSISYKSVDDLQAHINGILRATERTGRVDFRAEVDSLGLTLCVSDLKFVNFIKDLDNRIVAVDFGGYSFLPPSFFDFVLKHGDPSSFAYRISKTLQHPQSTQVEAMMDASFALVPFSSNNVGLPRRLRPR